MSALLEQIVRLPLDNPCHGYNPRADVPCGTCTRCCQGNSVVMLLEQEGDVIEAYEHEYVTLPGAGHGPILKRKPNGDCIYLGETGCTIHDRAPTVCRVFDCRGAYLAFMEYPRAERKRMTKKGLIDKEVFERGRNLLSDGTRDTERTLP